MFLGGLGRRVAGGSLNEWFHVDVGDLPVRLFYGAMLGLAALMGGAAWWVALAMILAGWSGQAIGGNFESLAMGREGHSRLHDWLGMSAHGAISAVAPTALVLYAGGIWWMTAVGFLSAALCYEIGWFVAEKTGNQVVMGKPMVYPWFPPGLQGGTQLAEVFWGAACGAGVFLSFTI